MYYRVFLLVFFSVNALADVQITQMTDFNLGTYTSGSMTLEKPVCVYSSNTDQRYNLRITTNDNAFVLKSGIYSIPFSLYWDADGSHSAQANFGVTYNFLHTHSSAGGLAGAASLNCVGGQDRLGVLKMVINQSDLENATAGNYNVVLRVAVSNP